MSMLRKYLEAAKADRPVYICELRDTFEREGVRPFCFHALLYDDSIRRFALKLPRCEGPEEAAFIEEYLTATLYNLISALGAREIRIFVDPADAALMHYASKLDDIFQVDVPIAGRSGYGKCLNVNQRVLAALCGDDIRFRFTVEPLKREGRLPEAAPATEGAPVFADLPVRAEKGRFMGMDIGGTDIKLVASLNGRLCAFKEYDWNPSDFTRAEQLTEPLVMLTRLMRCAVSMTEAGLTDEIPLSAFDRSADDVQITAAVAGMEARLGEMLYSFDGIKQGKGRIHILAIGAKMDSGQYDFTKTCRGKAGDFRAYILQRPGTNRPTD